MRRRKKGRKGEGEGGGKKEEEKMTGEDEGEEGEEERMQPPPSSMEKDHTFLPKVEGCSSQISSSCARNLISVCFLITTIFPGHIKISFLLLLLGKAGSAKF